MSPGIQYDSVPPGFAAASADALGRARRAFAAWRDPRALALRRRRRAKRATIFHSAVAGVSGVATLAIGESSGLELSEVASGSVAVLFGVAAVSSGWRTWRLHRSQLPHAMPAPGSAARDPLHRLAAAEARLIAVLAELDRPPFAADATPRPPASLLADVRAAATHAALSIRSTADSLVAVERAMAAAPPADRPALQAAVDLMRRRLDAGVHDFGGLVAAAGQTLATGDPAARSSRISEVIEKLECFTDAASDLARPAPGADPPGTVGTSS